MGFILKVSRSNGIVDRAEVWCQAPRLPHSAADAAALETMTAISQAISKGSGLLFVGAC